MTDYTELELQQMQREAEQRVREMQARAARTAQQQGWVGSLPQQPPPEEIPPARSAEQPHGNVPAGSPMGNLLQWAGGERGILLALLALLMGQNADPGLLLALVYLAMGENNSD